MFCMNCGTKVADGASFCPNCGTKLPVGTQGAAPGAYESPKTQLVAAKCTNCGGSLTVNPNLEAAICPFCNTPYIVEKAISNYRITNNYIGTQINIEGVSSGNLIELAESALKAGNFSEAMSYADRALETDPSDIKGWIVKIKAAGYDIDGDRTSEITTFIDAALDRSVSADDEVLVYSAVLDIAIIHLNEAQKMIQSNQEQIRRQVADHRDRNDIAAMDSGYILRTSKIVNEAMEYRNIVPESAFARSGVLQKKAVGMADAYSRYCNALADRHRIYGSFPSHQTQMRQRENLDKILGRRGGGQPPRSGGPSNPSGSAGGFFKKLFG